MGLLSLQEYLAQTLQEANWGLKGYLNQNIIKVKVHLLGRCFCTAGLEQEEALSGTTELLKALLDWTYLSVVLETCGGNVFPPLENRFQPGHPEGRVNQQRLLCLTHHALEHGINILSDVRHPLIFHGGLLWSVRVPAGISTGKKKGWVVLVLHCPDTTREWNNKNLKFASFLQGALRWLALHQLLPSPITS